MRTLILIFTFLFAASCSDHGPSEAHFPSRSVVVGGATYKYRIYVPRTVETGGKLPVILYLHGSGARGDDNRAQLGRWPDYLPAKPDRFPFIIVFPQCRAEAFWAGEMNQQALAALDQTVTEFGGDIDRLYLAGYSMGANGTWQNGLIHSEKFAALVPIAGYVAPQSKLSDEVLATLHPKLRAAATSSDPFRIFAEGLGTTPVWILHGSDDESVPVTESRQIFEALKIVGNENVKFSEFAGVGHDVLDRVFTEPGLFEWLVQQRRRFGQ